LYASVLDAEQQLEHNLYSDRHAWVQVARGELSVNGERLQPGDGIALSGEKAVSLRGITPCECLLFDLP
jgi:quercetin 2,3-dioxygenase